MSKAAQPATTRDGCRNPAKLLLPWFVTGTLDAGDRATVEAHLATCARCRRMLTAEHALRVAIVDQPVESDLAWQQFKHVRLDVPPRQSLRRWARDAVMKRPRRLAAIAAAQAAVIVLTVGVTTSATSAIDGFRGLSAAPAEAVAGNAIIVFRPDTTEAELRRILTAAQANIVNGPTPAEGYILRIPAVVRAREVVRLRAEPAVVTVAAIDGAGS